jgi:hypothetical protein
MTTPESRVKAKVREVLSRYPSMYTYWPVPSGFGRTTIDVIGCYRGRFFAIEVKAEGKKPTLRQTQELLHMARAMGKTFVISGTSDPAIDALKQWLDELTETTTNDPHLPSDKVRRHRI